LPSGAWLVYQPAMTLALFAAVALSATPPASHAEDRAADAKALLAELVAADTSNPPGNEARAVAIGAKRLDAAGIPYEITEFAPGRQNLVAKLKGDGTAKPLLLISHVDVVGAEGQTWSTPAHQMSEVSGYLQGRGVGDDLGMGVVDLELFIWLKESGIPLKRDVILAWTGDEESGGAGIQWLLAHKPESLNAEIALNEGGGPVLDDKGKVELVDLQTAEKTYQDVTLTAPGPTGHASIPLGDNAIVRLSRALDRIASHPFAPRLLPVTRAYLAGRAAFERPELAAAMRALAASAVSKGKLPAKALRTLAKSATLSALLRTTCEATLIHGGTRVNALPVSAEANLNCRILPDETPAQLRRALVAVIADPTVQVKLGPDDGNSGPSALTGAAPDAIRKVSAELWPGVSVIPSMSCGADDSRFLRPLGVNAYGLNPFPISDDDSRRAHGIDERIPADSLAVGLRYFEKLVLELAGR
jgi:acetylornithine deacetylase/succinyl-diaminopimelate desuccinylase-like protein